MPAILDLLGHFGTWTFLVLALLRRMIWRDGMTGKRRMARKSFNLFERLRKGGELMCVGEPELSVGSRDKTKRASRRV